MEFDDTGVTNLCVAIVKVACDDYRKLWEKKKNIGEIKHLEKFFHSSWFDLLSLNVLDGDTVIRVLKTVPGNPRLFRVEG